MTTVDCLPNSITFVVLTNSADICYLIIISVVVLQITTTTVTVTLASH